jgi:hypothetical protein
MGKPLKKLKGEKLRPRKPQGIPLCPIHSMEMEYVTESMHWACPDKACAQIAFPREEIEEGKPVVGRGIVELVMIDDPDGNRLGRYILRTIDNNVMVDITDYIKGIPKQNGDDSWSLELKMHYSADNRTRN